MRQMSARVQCFCCTTSLLGLHIFGSTPSRVSHLVYSCLFHLAQGAGLVGEGYGAAGLFTAPHLIVHLAKYSW